MEILLILFWLFVVCFIGCAIGWIVSVIWHSDAMYVWNIGLCGCALAVNLINLAIKLMQ